MVIGLDGVIAIGSAYALLGEDYLLVSTLLMLICTRGTKIGRVDAYMLSNKFFSL